MDMSPSPKKYDVYVSFRGEDTRTNFTSHLHSALQRNGIKVYIDDFLEKGEEVWKALSKAIEDSHIAVVVFSKNYASSKWCLVELVKILECRIRNGQVVVIPMFYEVDPSDIRQQKGTYGEAFAKYEGELLGDRDKEEVQKKVSEWRAALTEATNMPGWDTRSREYK